MCITNQASLYIRIFQYLWDVVIHTRQSCERTKHKHEFKAQKGPIYFRIHSPTFLLSQNVYIRNHLSVMWIWTHGMNSQYFYEQLTSKNAPCYTVSAMPSVSLLPLYHTIVQPQRSLLSIVSKCQTLWQCSPMFASVGTVCELSDRSSYLKPSTIT